MADNLFAHGTTFAIDGVLLANVTDFAPSGFSADDIDVTDHDSDGVKEFIKGLVDAGEISLTLNYGDTSLTAIYNDLYDFTSGNKTYTITYPSGNILTFDGYCKGCTPPSAPVDGKHEVTGVWKISGKPTYGAASDATTIMAINPVTVTAIDNSAATLTCAAGTTVDELIAAITSTDGSVQTYTVASAAAAPKTDDDALVSTDVLTVTAQDGATTDDYTITVSA